MLYNQRFSDVTKPSPVPLASLVTEFKLQPLTPKMTIITDIPKPAIHRPGLQLAGFYEYFDYERVQVIGNSEYSFLKSLTERERDRVFSKLFKYNIPCLVLCKGLMPFPEMLVHAKINEIPLYSTEWPTSEFIGEVIRWLKIKLAPRITIHGVLLDIYGEGVVIMGDSGIGKSETALELIKRGHRLVADDAVEVSRIAAGTLIGTCPKIIQYFIELRGIGIIDVRQMFGVEAVKVSQVVDIILNLEYWDERKLYDRLGMEDEYTEILGHNVITHSIPIRPGRNLAIICEAAAVNYRQKKMGYSAAKELSHRLKTLMD